MMTNEIMLIDGHSETNNEDDGMQLLKQYVEIKDDLLHFRFPNDPKKYWVYLFRYNERTKRLYKDFLRYDRDGYYLAESACLKWRMTHRGTRYERVCMYDGVKELRAIDFKEVHEFFGMRLEKEGYGVFYQMEHEPLAEHEKVYVYSYLVDYGETKNEEGRILIPKSQVRKDNDGWLIPEWLYLEKIREIKQRTGQATDSEIDAGKDKIVVHEFADIPAEIWLKKEIKAEKK